MNDVSPPENSTGTGTAIATREASHHGALESATAFSGSTAFESAQRMARLLSQSRMVPQQYQNNLPDALVALEIAQRTRSSPLMVMQNMHVIHGRPSWSSQFVIAALNSCGRFQPLQFRVEGEGDSRTCIAWTRDRHGNVLEGPPVSIQMAKDEGWYGRNGSKWKTMPELMLRYRAAKFFGNLYAPDVLMGMQTSDEAVEIEGAATEVQAAPTPTGNLAAPLPDTPAPETGDQSTPQPETSQPSASDGVPLVSADGEVVQQYRRIGDFLNALEKLAEQGNAGAVLDANAGALDRIAADKPKAAERIAEIREKFTPKAADAEAPAQETATDAAENGDDSGSADDTPPAGQGAGSAGDGSAAAGDDEDWF